MKARRSKPRRRTTKTARETRADGDVTRGRLLDAAGALFAVGGFAHTTAKAIAKRADVTVALINYHFESRAGLYRAVLVEAHQRFLSLGELREVAGSELSASEKLKSLIGQLVKQATNRKLEWHLDVLGREILAPSPHLHALTQTALPPKLAIITQVLSEITRIPANDPALLRCFLSAVTPCTVLLLMARGAPGPMHNLRQMAPEVLTDHLHRFAMAGLDAIARGHIRDDAPCKS
jgi:TetR/AcrR family transcriptional regulator, regulator of cefoperazone and chloramphenicol sensitivity